ncbi:hypothetical protein NQ317_003487 [Molorchus minor]|uniref:Uncharacterized protein n=1 Tax=Molorchus minor TaxID=1323400 RepID=A0ABQ9K0P1_9CUCU|nr:hypothetical protein NQ317_003487 [Molorchus minor]
MVSLQQKTVNMDKSFTKSDSDNLSTELAHKLSRSFDMKDEQNLLDGEGGMRRHQSMQRLTRDGMPEQRDPAKVELDEEGNLRITVKKD